MIKTLVILILAVIVLSWNFVFTDNKKVDLTDPAKVLQGLSHAIKYKRGVREYWKVKKVLPDAAQWAKEGKKFESDYSKSLVERIEVGVDAPGSVKIFFMNKKSIKLEKNVNGTNITLMPKVNGESLIWSCIGTLPQEYMPKKCKQAVSKENIN